MAWMAMAAQMAPAVIGGISGALGGGGSGDPVADMRQVWGRKYLPDIKALRNQIGGLDDRTFYEGQTYADLDPAQAAAYQGMVNFGMNNPAYGMQLGQGQLGLGNLGMGSSFLNQQMRAGAPQFQFDQGLFNQSMENLMPGLQGTYDDLTRDITRDLNWNQLPGLDLNLSAAGGMGGSRGQLAGGMLQGMAQDRMADVGSQLYQNALNQSFGAGMTSGQENLGGYLQNQQQLLGGASQLAGRGLPGIGDAYGTGISNLQTLLAGGTGFQQQQQLGIDEAIARFNYNRDQPYRDIADKTGLYSGIHFPTGQAVSAPPGMNTLDAILSGAQAGAGIYDTVAGLLPDMGRTPDYNPWAPQNQGAADYLASLGIYGS